MQPHRGGALEDQKPFAQGGARTRAALDGSSSLQVFVWPPGTATRIHDHSSWGAYCCALGTIFEERYERLDDGSQRDHARLKKSWERAWNEGDGASTVLPYDGGIHSMGTRARRRPSACTS